MLPGQRRVFDQLLEIGGDRPVAPDGLAPELAREVLAQTATAVQRWTETTLWLSKSRFMAALRCEGCLLADAQAPKTSMPAAVGTITHKAIQIAGTFGDRSVRECVDAAIAGVCRDDSSFGDFWANADLSTQTDLISKAASGVTSFVDGWPSLLPSWTPRWEEPMSSSIGNLTLSARADLVLGRPRANGCQTMLIVDLKSGALHPNQHRLEAGFHALVSTLRWGVPPFRSVVYALSSGEWEAPNITPLFLLEVIEAVGRAVSSVVDVLTGVRAPVLAEPTVWHSEGCPVRERASAPTIGLLAR